MGLAGTPCRLLGGASRIQLQLQLRALPFRSQRPQLGLSLSCRQADATVIGLHRQLQRVQCATGWVYSKLHVGSVCNCDWRWTHFMLGTLRVKGNLWGSLSS